MLRQLRFGLVEPPYSCCTRTGDTTTTGGEGRTGGCGDWSSGRTFLGLPRFFGVVAEINDETSSVIVLLCKGAGVLHGEGEMIVGGVRETAMLSGVISNTGMLASGSSSSSCLMGVERDLSEDVSSTRSIASIRLVEALAGVDSVCSETKQKNSAKSSIPYLLKRNQSSLTSTNYKRFRKVPERRKI